MDLSLQKDCSHWCAFFLLVYSTHQCIYMIIFVYNFNSQIPLVNVPYYGRGEKKVLDKVTQIKKHTQSASNYVSNWWLNFSFLALFPASALARVCVSLRVKTNQRHLHVQRCWPLKGSTSSGQPAAPSLLSSLTLSFRPVCLRGRAGKFLQATLTLSFSGI